MAIFTGVFSHRRTGLFLATLLVFSFALSLSACDKTDNKSAGNSGHKIRSTTHRVETIDAEIKSVALTQTISGTLQAVTKIRFYNEESGRITRLPYYEGDRVKKGDLLVQLDNELLKTDVAKARAAREQARVDLDRLKKLLPNKISTEEEVARAQTVLDLARTEEKHQLTRLQRTSIKSPINGMVTKRLYEPGDLLPPQSHILSIIDPSALRLKAGLAERWLPLVKKDQAVKLKIDALGDRRFDAKVIRIHPTIDASTHKGIIEIQLSPVPEGARIGQFTRASIELKASDRLVIPVYIIHYEPAGAFVFRIVEKDDGSTVVEKVFFEQGQQFSSVVEVLSGLQAGDKIVSRGFIGLRAGKKVEVADTFSTSSTDLNTSRSSNINP